MEPCTSLKCICREDDISVHEASVVHAVVVVCTCVSITPKLSVEFCCVPRPVRIVLHEHLVRKRTECVVHELHVTRSTCRMSTVVNTGFISRMSVAISRIVKLNVKPLCVDGCCVEACRCCPSLLSDRPNVVVSLTTDLTTSLILE